MALTKLRDHQVTYNHGATGSEVRNIGDKLREFVSVKDFGADPSADGATNAAAFVSASTLGKKVYVPSGTYICTAFTLAANTVLFGDGHSSKLVFTAGNVGTNDCINMGANCELRDLYMEPETKAQSYSVLPSLVPEAVFSYNNNIDAPRLGENCKAINCVFDGFNSGIQADSDNVVVDQCISKGGYAALNFYDVTGFSITNSQFYGGTYGCVALPSCKNGRVIGNIVIAPGSTGVNPGGSSASGFEVKNITIADNIITCTNGVTCELGSEAITITGNVIMVANPVSTDGVGIGVATRNGGSFIRNIAVTGNIVQPLEPTQAFSSGISVGNDDPAGPDVAVENVTITGNSIKGATQGIIVQAQISSVIGATITANRIAGGRFGLYLIGLKRFTASENVMEADTPTTISNYYGIIYLDCVGGVFSGNVIRGYGEHIRQIGNASSDLSFIGNKHIANDDAVGYLQYVNTGSGADAMLRMAEAIPAAFGIFDGTGSGTLTPLHQRGVTSIVKTGTGNYTVTLERDFVTSTPVVLATAGNTSGASGAAIVVESITANSFVLRVFITTTTAAADGDLISFACIGV